MNLGKMFNFKSDYIKNVIIIFVALVFSFVAFKCFMYFVYADINSANYYMQGTEFLNKKDYQNAFYNYSRIRPSSEYYQLALYRQAYCASQLSDTTMAIEKYSALVHKYPMSIFTPKATYELAKEQYNLNEFDSSEQFFHQVQELYPGTDYDIAANYFLGMIKKAKAKKTSDELVYAQSNMPFEDELTLADNYNQDIIVDATKDWLVYLEKCPSCKYSLACIDEIITLNKHILPEINTKLGAAYYLNDNYEKAADYIQRGNSHKYWNYLYLAEKKLGHEDSARKIFEENLTKYSRGMDNLKLNEVLSVYVASYPASEKKAVWLALLKLVRQNQTPSEDFVLYNLANLSGGEERLNYYNMIVKQFPRSDYAPESLWELFRYLYKHNFYDKAVIAGDKYISAYPKTNMAPAVIFWMGKIHHSQKQLDKAKFYYQKLMNEYPDEYYTYRAASMYKMRNLNWHSNSNKSHKKLEEQTNVVTLPFDYAKLSEKDATLINLAFGANDLDVLDDLQMDNKVIQSWILYKNGNYSTSAVLARDWIKDTFPRPTYDKEIYKLAYPLLYSRQVVSNAAKLDLDAFLILALIKEESYFNKNAKSSSGAAGLMQIMPDTAKYIAAQRGIAYNSVDELLNPDYNIMLGCNYFDYIKDKLKNSNLLAVAAYNGGPGAVDYWLKNKEYADFDEFVEDIPYPETRNYVKKVYKSYWNYLNIYE